MGIRGLFGQQAPLAHTEAVLFVHDGQTQPGELHALAEDGVGAYDEVGLIVPDGGEGGAPCGGLHAAGEQGHPHPEGESRRFRFSACWLARISVGASSAA